MPNIKLSGVIFAVLVTHISAFKRTELLNGGRELWSTPLINATKYEKPQLRGLKLKAAANSITEFSQRRPSKACISDFAPSHFSGKRVLLRADLNVPFSKENGVQIIADDTRIQASVPTLRYLLDSGAKLVVMSHLGRPLAGEFNADFSMKPVAERLGELLNVPVFAADFQSSFDDLENASKRLGPSEVLLMENVRFYKGETSNSRELSQSYSRLGDIFVNDAFGSAHRSHASTTGVTEFIKESLSGFLLKRELDFLQDAISAPKRPFAAIVGGSKVSSKIGILKSLVQKVNILVIGGAMAFTFFKARGLNVGSSLVEDDKLSLARELEEEARQRGVRILLPSDVVLANEYSENANTKIVDINDIKDGWMGLDHGPKTSEEINEALSTCKTILWNGPLGVSEIPKFANGTNSVANMLAKLTKNGVLTIVGGGDSVAALTRLGIANEITHVSTGGGASLELLQGIELPGVAALNNAPQS